MEEREEVLGLIRVKLASIDLETVMHDLVLVPKPENEDFYRKFCPGDQGKSSLLSCKMRRNEERLYNSKLTDFSHEIMAVEEGIEWMNDKKNKLNQEIIETVGKIRGLQWKTDDDQKGKDLTEVKKYINQIEEEMLRLDQYVKELEKEEAAQVKICIYLNQTCHYFFFLSYLVKMVLLILAWNTRRSARKLLSTFTRPSILGQWTTTGLVIDCS
jgi:hypothetical protein